MVSQMVVRWAEVQGVVEKYQISVDGKVLTTAGPNARSTKVSVSEFTVIEVVDLPRRSVTQVFEITQKEYISP